MKKYHRRYLLLLILSLLLHLVAYLALKDLFKVEPRIDDEEKITITLKPSTDPVETEDITSSPEETPPEKEEVKKDEPAEELKENAKEEVHAPMDNADEFASSNQADQSITQLDPGAPPKIEEPMGEKTSQQVDIQQPEQTPIELKDQTSKENIKQLLDKVVDEEGKKAREREILDSDTIDWSRIWSEQTPTQGADDEFDQGDSQSPVGKETPNIIDIMSGSIDVRGEESDEQASSENDIHEPGNALLLSESQLRQAVVEHPFSEKKSNELKLANKYLERMNKQVLAFWVNPYKGNRLLQGVIKFELDTKGNLVNSYVYISSGDPLLDAAARDAIRAVPRYDVPANEVIASRYYSNLSFHYSSKEIKPELMPYEKEEN